MDMDQAPAAAGTAQGDLADVVARAGAIMAAASPPSTSHPRRPPRPSSLAAADHIMSSAAAMAGAGQIMVVPYDEEPRPACSDAAVMFDPYLPSSATAPPGGGYWLPPQQQLALQISQHACYSRDVAMAGAATEVDGDEAAMRISPPAHHQIMKSRKNEVKKVVCIPALPQTSSRPGGGGEVIPSDLWAWRKYGQKPIKGSPYPRGYYRCSSSKGCMARKQVERSRSDPNMLVITYTAEHNHPWPLQRNVLAGYSRPHTHTSTTNCKKKNSYRVGPQVTSSPSPSKNNYYSEHNAVASGNLECQQQKTADMMEGNASSSAGYVAYTSSIVGALDEEGVAMHQPMMSCNSGIQTADEVFAELEELEPSDPPVSANIYSRGASYEWHKF